MLMWCHPDRNNSVTVPSLSFGLCAIYVAMYVKFFTPLSLSLSVNPSLHILSLLLFFLSSLSSFPSLHAPRAARRLPHLVKTLLSSNTMNHRSDGGVADTQAACCICFQWQASGWKSMTSQDVFTMTGCRCPKLAGRESNFAEHFVFRHTSHF